MEQHPVASIHGNMSGTPQASWGSGNNAHEVTNETQVSATSAGAGSKLPEFKFMVYFHYTFNTVKLWGKDFHTSVIAIKL